MEEISKLYYLKDGVEDYVGTFASEDDIFAHIADKARAEGHGYYFRYWDRDDGRVVDYGSHTSFFIIKPVAEKKKVPTIRWETDKAVGSSMIPKRATSGSAGFDFVSPYDIDLFQGDLHLLDTHIKAVIPKGYVLLVFPRSSLGAKGLVLENTVAVIDSDYRDTIKVWLRNRGEGGISISRGERFAQGIVIPYIHDGVEVETERQGGFGSTGK